MRNLVRLVNIIYSRRVTLSFLLNYEPLPADKFVEALRSARFSGAALGWR